MYLQFVPLLQIQRDLYSIPRGMARFRHYVRTMVNDRGDDLDRAPLVAMNPMAKDHVAALLDDFLKLDAESVATRCVAETARQVMDVDGEYKVGLVVADDLMGAWTNRWACEFGLRFGDGRPRKQPWISCVLWSSESASVEAVREAVLTNVYRTAYVLRHGVARTLRDRMAQEGHVMALAGCPKPVLDDDDIAYTREVIAPFLDAEDMRTTIECLFGDAAGATLGFGPRGFSEQAGLALALHDALASTAYPRLKSGGAILIQGDHGVYRPTDVQVYG